MAPNSSAPAVTIVLLNWNSKVDTLECLESVFRLRYDNYNVVLCDNESTDGSVEAFKQWADGHLQVTPASETFSGEFAAPRTEAVVAWREFSREQSEAVEPDVPIARLTLIRTGGNLGFAGGNNVGIRFAIKHLAPDFVWLLNTDTLADPEALSALVTRAMLGRDIGIVGSTLVYYWRPSRAPAQTAKGTCARG